jgi:hypothetical protein
VAKHFQDLKISIARVLDVMAHHPRHQAHVICVEISLD